MHRLPPPFLYRATAVSIPSTKDHVLFREGWGGGEGEGLEIILRVVKSEADTLYSLTESRL